MVSSPACNIERLSHFFLSLENSSDSQRPPGISVSDEQELLLFYGIKRDPFANEPGTESSLHNAPGHYGACQRLNYCIEEELPIGVLTAPNGMGRGLVLQDLIQALPPRQHSAVTMTVEAGMQELAFAKNLLYELGVTDIHRKNLNIHHLLELLKESVLRQSAAKNVRLILCFEEAQTMTIKIFSLLQWLLNIEASRRKLVTILLVGDPSLHDKFQQKGMEFLKNRIYASVQLAPLTLTETENYLHDKLAMAHCTRKIFTPAAAQIIFSAAAGLHREINSLAHTALIRAFELRKKRIDQAVMRRCLADAA